MQPVEDLKANRKQLVLETICVAAVAMITAASCLFAAQRVGPVYDERIYFERGLDAWEVGSHSPLFQIGTMPLPVDLQTLPLAVSKYVFGHDPRADFIGYLPYMRAMTLVFWWWLIGASYLTVRGRAGAAAACLTVGLLAAEPVLLGHAALATTDIAAAATLVTVLLVSQRCYDQGRSTRIRRTFTAVAIALALFAKATALVFVPVCLFAVETERLWRSGWRPRFDRAALQDLLPAVREVVIVFGLGILLVVVPFPRVLSAFLLQVRHNVHGHGFVFLLGKTEPGGFWYYFFVAAASKFTLTMLAYAGAAIVFGRRNFLNAPLLAATVLLLLSPAYQVQLGVRFIFGIVALLVIGASLALFEHRGEPVPSRLRRRFGIALASLAILGSSYEAYRVWPNGMCFTNQLFGGTDLGYLTLCESNYDWGQGFDDLAAWHREQNQPELSAWSFGLDPRWGTGPMKAISGDVYTVDTMPQFFADIHSRYLAVSLSNLYAYHRDTPVGRYLLEHEPCSRTQTFLIYDFRRTEPPRATEGAIQPPVFSRR